MRCNFKSEDKPQVVIVTHGRIAAEALSACKALDREGISVGIVLLEYIKPYDEIADRLATYLPQNAKVLFLEEEIRSGGMGMNLADACIRQGMLCEDQYAILATDDSFVDDRSAGESIYESAGVSEKHIIQAICELID